MSEARNTRVCLSKAVWTFSLKIFKVFRSGMFYNSPPRLIDIWFWATDSNQPCHVSMSTKITMKARNMNIWIYCSYKSDYWATWNLNIIQKALLQTLLKSCLLDIGRKSPNSDATAELQRFYLTQCQERNIMQTRIFDSSKVGQC